MKINIDELIGLYDTKRVDEWNEQLGSPITSITGLIGEDLILGILQDCLKKQPGNKSFSISRVPPKAGGRGAQLDAWVYTPNEHYQVEIKSWSASAVGGRPITPNNEKKLLEACEINKHSYLINRRNSKKVWKVLEKMQDEKSRENNKITPRKALLAFWSPIANDEDLLEKRNLKPFFEIDDLSPFQDSINHANLRSCEFNKVSVFSASLYLRQLRDQGIADLELDMLRVEDRLQRLVRLIPDIFTAVSTVK